MYEAILAIIEILKKETWFKLKTIPKAVANGPYL